MKARRRDVTPQVEQWLAGDVGAGAFVLRGDDEALDVFEPAGACTTQVSGLALTIEFGTAPER
jgi:hypothetical protein